MRVQRSSKVVVGLADGKRETGVTVAEALSPSSVILRSNVTLRNATDLPLAASLRPLSTLRGATSEESQRGSPTGTGGAVEGESGVPYRIL
jgi:hypothetical protein